MVMLAVKIAVMIVLTVTIAVTNAVMTAFAVVVVTETVRKLNLFFSSQSFYTSRNFLFLHQYDQSS
jgi:hypothetical protein